MDVVDESRAVADVRLDDTVVDSRGVRVGSRVAVVEDPTASSTTPKNQFHRGFARCVVRRRAVDPKH